LERRAIVLSGGAEPGYLDHTVLTRILEASAARLGANARVWKLLPANDPDIADV
jgi:hypothetical protein